MYIHWTCVVNTTSTLPKLPASWYLAMSYRNLCSAQEQSWSLHITIAVNVCTFTICDSSAVKDPGSRFLLLRLINQSIEYWNILLKQSVVHFHFIGSIAMPPLHDPSESSFAQWLCKNSKFQMLMLRVKNTRNHMSTKYAHAYKFILYTTYSYMEYRWGLIDL